MRSIVDAKKSGRPSDAMSIVEELAAATGTALLEADFSSFAARFMFPHYVITQSGEREVRNAGELRRTFDKVIDHYRLSGVDRMERYCVFGTYIDDATIECAHESRLYHNDTLVQQSFVAKSTLKRECNAWKIFSTEYSISDSLRYVRALTE